MSEILGVLGGLGPLATNYFLDLVLNMTEISVEQDHLDMIVYSFPSIPDRTGYILDNSRPSPLPGLKRSAQGLSRQGVGSIVIPCITAHYFYADIQAAVPDTPIIHAVNDTVDYLREAGITAAGVMATDGTIATGLFCKALTAAGIRPVLPSKARQADVMHLIYSNIKAGLPPEMDRFLAVSRELRENGAEAIILGCTELSLIKRDFDIGPGFLDTMEVMARSSILRCGKKLRMDRQSLIT